MKSTPSQRTKELYRSTHPAIPGVLPPSYFSKVPEPLDLAPYIQMFLYRKKMDTNLPYL